MMTASVKQDLVNSLRCLGVTLPFSLALSIAFNLSVETVLLSTLVASAVTTLFSKTQFTVSAPSLALSVVFASVVERHGVTGLLMIASVTGVLQFLFGYFRIGRLASLVPTSVLLGFNSAMGALIILAQLPHALGFSDHRTHHLWTTIRALPGYLSHANGFSVTLSLTSFFACLVFQRWWRLALGSLLAVLFTTLLSLLLGHELPHLGSFHGTVSFHLPSLSAAQYQLSELMTDILLVFSITTLETILSLSTLEKFVPNSKYDPNYELMLQGGVNTLLSCVGGIPVTSLIHRSYYSFNYQALNKRTSLFYTFFSTLIFFMGLPFLYKVPIASLTGVLLFMAFNLFYPKELFKTWKINPFETATYATTFLSILFFDLVSGVKLGILVALIVFLLQYLKGSIDYFASSHSGPHRLFLSGYLSILSTSHLKKASTWLLNLPLEKGVIFEAPKLEWMDATAQKHFLDVLQQLQEKKVSFYLKEFSETIKTALLQHMPSLSGTFIFSETEINEPNLVVQGRESILIGIRQFEQVKNKGLRQLYEKLEAKQNPHTLFITCSDSRISPHLVTGTQPGDLFIIRTAGNFVPRSGEEQVACQGASIEFAVGVLKVKDIIVCGHSNCGVMKGILNLPSELSHLKSLTGYLDHLKRHHVQGNYDLNDFDLLAKNNVRVQSENLKTYPVVAERLTKGELRIFSWYLDIGQAQFFEWQDSSKSFTPLISSTSVHA